MSDLNNTAAPQAAGYIFQLDRALHHLAVGEAGAWVAVEHIDDVAVIQGGKLILQEQDKTSTVPRRALLGDRSPALWRTLQIWMSQRYATDPIRCERYLLVSNHPVDTPIASAIKQLGRGEIQPEAVVAALRKAGAGRGKSKIQTMIDDVLLHSDKHLLELVVRVEIVETSDADRTKIANGLAIDSRTDADAILDGLLGWLTRMLRVAWHEKRPGMVSREACVHQCRELEASQARRRFLPRPAREVTVSDAERQSARARPFVEHLSRIDAVDEDVYQAVDHFIQFNVEKYRLAAEGEIPDHEWGDRGDRLKQRWRNVMRVARREAPSAKPQDVGLRVLERSTYDHLEPLGGEHCAELYMTAGHYHRLADEDEVWWDPRFDPKGGSDAGQS